MSKPILWRIRNFNQLVCGTFGHNFGKPTPFLSTNGKGICGHKKECTRCSHEIKEYEQGETTYYPRLS